MGFTDVGFEVIVASYCDYEELVAEIHFDGKLVALVNREKGPEMLELELPGLDLNEEYVARKVDLRGFLDAVEKASRALRD